ncbi:NHL repeat-containing protein [bacterium]|nr:NHL repeat-containing protein [bacterium]
MGRVRAAAVPVATVLVCLLAAGCAGGGGGRDRPGDAPALAAPRPGTSVAALEFLYSFENDAGAPYYPINGIAGCGYGPDGTLFFCDEQKGMVHYLDPSSRLWAEFDVPMARPYTPIDVRVDGFKVLVLDQAGGRIYRFDLGGTLLDTLLELRNLTPGFPITATAFDVDQDGRMVIADASGQQVLLLDTFMNLTMRLGGPGRMRDQMDHPAGIVFRSDGSFLVSDQGNRRLGLYGRLGFFEDDIGGDFDPGNRFVAPQGIDRDRFGNVFVADPGSGRIHVLDSRLRWGFSSGPEFGLQAAPLAPVDLAVGPGDLLAVSDRVRAALLVYRIVYE